MSEKEFEEAFSDKAFVEELLKLKTGEQVKKALEKKGIYLTPEEFDKFAKVLLETLESNKLHENELKNFSGGVKQATNDVIVRGAEILADNLATNFSVNFEDVDTDSFWGRCFN